MEDSSLRPPGVAVRARFVASSAYARALAAAGVAAGRIGRRLLLRVHRHEEIPAPAVVEIGGTRFDVAADLEEYTRLPHEQVTSLLRREQDSFRVEWYMAPAPMRQDDWYYLASSAYLFGNATHDPRPIVATVERELGRPGRALEFGGGTGNVALALAAAGWSVDYLERSALQKDFTRFRSQKHGLVEHLRVLDDWHPLEPNSYDLVCAFDVFEHVADVASLLNDSVLPTIRSGGALLESSPFVRNLSNPMHHEHADFDDVLMAAGFQVAAETPECRIWRRSGTTR